MKKIISTGIILAYICGFAACQVPGFEIKLLKQTDPPPIIDYSEPIIKYS